MIKSENCICMIILCMFSHLNNVDKYLPDSVYSISNAQIKMETVGILSLQIPDAWRHLRMSPKFSVFIQMFGVMSACFLK